MIFRHLLRLILLIEEFRPLIPEGTTAYEWEADLTEFGEKLTACCRAVDPASTEETLAASKRTDLTDNE